MISGNLLFLLSALGFSNFVTAFTASPSAPATAFSTQLHANNEENDDYMRWARQARSADVADNVVELVRPLGLVLKEDDRGNVFVDKIAPKGNAARTGKVGYGARLGIEMLVLTPFALFLGPGGRRCDHV